MFAYAGEAAASTLDLWDAITRPQPTTILRGKVTAVEEGDADAQLEFGLRLFEGKGVAKDPTRAVELFEQAAAQGQALADCALAICWARGEGVAFHDKDKALRHLDVAIRAGIPLAAALKAELGAGAADRVGMLVLLDALRSALVTQASTNVTCPSRNLALNRLVCGCARCNHCLRVCACCSRSATRRCCETARFFLVAVSQTSNLTPHTPNSESKTSNLNL